MTVSSAIAAVWLTALILSIAIALLCPDSLMAFLGVVLLMVVLFTVCAVVYAVAACR